MSTLKADTVTSSTTNGNLSLTGNGSGGVTVTDHFILSKGSDIASATALSLGVDGNAFDVTGTTTITSIGTQGIGSHITLHFDGILTFTHHSTDLILPGAANITTAVGDIAVMHEYASGDWRCVSYTKASGAAVVASSAGLTLIETLTPSGAATAIFTAAAMFDSTYDRIQIECVGLDFDTNDTFLDLTVSDDAGSSFESASYRYGFKTGVDIATTNAITVSTSAAFIRLLQSPGAESDESMDMTITVSNLDNTAFHKNFYWHGGGVESSGRSMILGGMGHWAGGVTAINQIKIFPASGTFSAAIRAYGLANS